jgi:hypothetical protein
MRRLGWILWLFIALLPLRGMAHAVMNALPPAPPAAMTMADGQPCAMQADDMNTGVGCTQCDLCCAVVAPAPATPVHELAQATPAPTMRAPGGLPPAPLDRLYRPPR